MSSWIPSLFNPFTDDDNNLNPPEHSSPPKSPAAGARDDLSAVFRGVAAFLAPPPAATASSSEAIDGIKSDLAEIQGTFRSGLSLISSKITSNLLQLQNQISDGDGNDGVEEEGEEEDDDEEDGLGISEEILEFVLKISRRPELWTDFPLSMPEIGNFICKSSYFSFCPFWWYVLISYLYKCYVFPVVFYDDYNSVRFLSWGYCLLIFFQDINLWFHEISGRLKSGMSLIDHLYTYKHL